MYDTKMPARTESAWAYDEMVRRNDVALVGVRLYLFYQERCLNSHAR